MKALNSSKNIMGLDPCMALIISLIHEAFSSSMSSEDSLNLAITAEFSQNVLKHSMDPSPCQKVVFTKNLDILSEIRQIQSKFPNSATKMQILSS